MFTGLLLIAAALLLQGYNLWDQARADRLAAEQLRALKLAMADRDTENLPFDPDMEMPTVTIDGMNTSVRWKFPVSAFPCR